MKFIDLTGQRFGRLTVLEVIDKRVKGSGNIIWKCQCDCGNIIEASNTRLKYTNIQSCGCIRKEKAKNKRKEYIGKILGKLVILGEADTSSDKKIIFRCQCDCGNIYEASLNALKSGKRISCGCFQPEKPVEDFSGQRFGNLIVLENTNKRAGGGNRNYIWKCKCDCGNIIGAAASDLKNGFTKCCGCTDSESIVYNVDDLTGQRFGRLVILGEAEQETSSTCIGDGTRLVLS